MALACGTATLAMWPFPYLGLLSLLLLPVTALCWTRLVILSRRAGSAAARVAVVAIATLVATAVTYRWLAGWWPTRS